MSHLTLETLARLLDEPATELEAAHLRDCAVCAAELTALRADGAALGGLGAIAPPAAAWPALEQRLRNEGLLRARRASWQTMALRIAAALALFLTGTLVGTRIAASPTTELATAPVPQPQQTAVPVEQLPERVATNDEPAPATVAEPAVQPAPVPEPRILGPAPDDFGAYGLAGIDNADEASRSLSSAESAYLNALTRYAQVAGPADNGDPLARLAALESILLTTREALGRSPADPVINGYHVTALAQRDATLRQIAATTRNPWF